MFRWIATILSHDCSFLFVCVGNGHVLSHSFRLTGTYIKSRVPTMECNPKGRLLHTFGKEKMDDKFEGGCIFMDNASGYIHVEFHSRGNSHETLRSTRAFEQLCASYGVVPQNYISDGGVTFTGEAFQEHLKEFHQTLRVSAPGAHHSNGIAERNISTIMSNLFESKRLI